jgi:hypothetical protein
LLDLEAHLLPLLKRLESLRLHFRKKSSPLSSGVMKPKPFASLNHFTVPVAIIVSRIENRPGYLDAIGRVIAVLAGSSVEKR